jgi:chemotaxis protein MotB
VADEKHEILIIKRSREGSHEPHGGAWKIAFADFMTAMMALFLVLWLVNATNQKTKASLARYFNPVDLVDMSTLKRGVHDPTMGPGTDGIANGAAFPKSVKDAVRKNGSLAGTSDGAAGPSDAQSEDHGPQTAEPVPTHSEEALFRDPYAVLAEIAAGSGSSAEAATDEHLDQSADNDGSGTTPDVYSDPFKADGGKADEPAPANPSAVNPPAANVAVQQQASAPPPASRQAAAPPPVVSPPPVTQQPAPARDKAQMQQEQPLNNAQTLAQTLQKQIADLIASSRKDTAEPAIEVKATDEGVLISLTDKSNFAMFAIGSAEPQRKTVHVMEKIAEVLKKQPGDIIIGGYTDARPYHSGTYDNWRLSTDRAQMAYYMLTRGGLGGKRILRIEGYADRRPKVPSRPLADENRRIEIFLKVKKS